MSEKAKSILAAVGGKENVHGVEACITRLRIEVLDPSQVDEMALRKAGAFGVVFQESVIQIVVGPEADDLGAAISEL